MKTNNETKKITFKQFCDMDFIRSEQMKIKSEATWVTFLELDGLINVAKFAREYMGKSAPWMQQRLKGYSVNGRPSRFKAEDYALLVKSLREVAGRLNQYADAIDSAELEE